MERKSSSKAAKRAASAAKPLVMLAAAPAIATQTATARAPQPAILPPPPRSSRWSLEEATVLERSLLILGRQFQLLQHHLHYRTSLNQRQKPRHSAIPLLLTSEKCQECPTRPARPPQCKHRRKRRSGKQVACTRKGLLMSSQRKVILAPLRLQKVLWSNWRAVAPEVRRWKKKQERRYARRAMETAGRIGKSREQRPNIASRRRIPTAAPKSCPRCGASWVALAKSSRSVQRKRRIRMRMTKRIEDRCPPPQRRGPCVPRPVLF
mmetsp:Transcript_79508/g.165090  ORF Transcript_79508/g.165090 Transcript_79508/m.165090 type:complete len:265 (+) Transcript_79508:386-1180(+)